MSAKSPTVLLVDDHVDTVELFVFALTQKNYEVVPAHSVREAFGQLQSRQFDLIMLDSRLPDGTGIELSRKIRLTDRKTPILFCSGLAQEKDKRAAIEAGAQGYLVKPIHLREMCAAVAELTGKAG